jgi:DNA-binding MarR family transcriptional regulator
MTGELDHMGLIGTRSDPADNRAKLLCLTAKGVSFVVSTEKHLRGAMQPLLKGVSTADLAAYLLVLETITANSVVAAAFIKE